jgi:ABC-2 type transport system permease protein
MTYLNKIVTVTLWEYRRFFKPKNEALGIAIMLLVSLVFYFGSKIAFSDSKEKTDLTVFQILDTTLTDRLLTNFNLHEGHPDQKSSMIEAISNTKKGIILIYEDNNFIIHAYKDSKVVKKLKTTLDEYQRSQNMKKFGLSQTDLNSILAPALTHESYIYTKNSKSRVLLAYFFAGLMIIAVFLSFAYQFTAITGEKQLKITEQIISAISPQLWMDGKIFGITLTGLSSMLTYSLLSIIGGVLLFQFTGSPISTIFNYLHLPSIILYIPFALIGILIWNAILAAIASAITDPNNSGKSSLMMLPLLFVAASFIVTNDPDKSISVFLSWFPLTSATSMPIRWAITEVELWQLAGSFSVLVLTFYLLRKLAAKIFRVSILISGKEPSWNKIFKLLKEKQ